MAEEVKEKRKEENKEEVKLPRAWSVADVLSKKHRVLNFNDKWKVSFGTPEMSGSWFIWGHSGNGKTTLILEMCKYLANFGRIAYNTLEEGNRLSMQLAFKRIGMETVRKNFIMISEDIDTLKLRLNRHKSPDIIIIDSIQYTGLNKMGYKKLINEFPRKLFIINSHAEGKQPEGRTAKSIRYDSGVKIWVEGFKAFISSRYGGGEDFIIVPHKAEEHWNNNKKKK